MKIALTGITGFLGGEVALHLHAAGFEIRAFVRALPNTMLENIEYVAVGDFRNISHWQPLLNGCDAVVHLAAFAHQNLHEEAEYAAVNVDVTRLILSAAKIASVQKFIFMSSVKVLGETTKLNMPFTNDTPPNPQDAYGRTKLLAEDLVRNSGLDYTILRPPLIYGKQLKGNLALLEKLISLHMPLPFGSVKNKRSLVSTTRVAQKITEAVNGEMSHQTVLIADPQDYSTPDIVRLVGKQIGVTPIIVSFPVCVLRLALKMLGKVDMSERLFGNLQVRG